MLKSVFPLLFYLNTRHNQVLKDLTLRFNLHNDSYCIDYLLSIYCRPTKTKTSPFPLSKDDMAFPMVAPRALS